jgi:predicted GIY-YIG superfamily endonuclease/ribosomal protein L37E
MSETTNIYVLSLQGGRIYVGKSNDVKKRFDEHKAGYGSAWTSKYKPIEILKVIENASPFDEDRYVKEYMDKYGVNNVRGGSYCTFELSKEQIASIQKEIRGATDCCSRCGREGHFVKNCDNYFDISGARIRDDKHESYGKKPQVKKNVCYRCGRDTHYADDCYASTHVRGYYID